MEKINPKELRIGNLVRFRETRREKSKSIVPNDKTEFAIRGILLRERIIGRDNLVWQINYIEPIPLTEEWLLSLGFNKCKSYSGDEHTIDYTSGFAYINSFDDTISFRGKGTANWDRIKYVHQLQNLYFALTGNELVYSL